MPLFFEPGSPDDDTYRGPDLRAGHETPLACDAIGHNHSGDRVRVYYGGAIPITVCGYHATYNLDSEGFAAMRADGQLSYWGEVPETVTVSQAIWHTDPTRVTDVKITDAPMARSASGYGRKLPTRYMIRYRAGQCDETRGRWHRVYAMQYGNAGSLYVRTGGHDAFLDIDTEYRLRAARDGEV